MLNDASEIWMVVAEVGSDWAVWADRFRLATPDVVIVFQQWGEASEAFARRVRGRTQRLTSDGRRIGRAVFVPNTSPGQLGPRSLVARALTSAMRGDGQLMLAENDDDRYTMEALFQSLREVVRESGTSIAIARALPVAEVA